MQHHNQTIADLERMEETSSIEVFVYFVVFALGLAAFFLFFLSF